MAIEYSVEIEKCGAQWEETLARGVKYIVCVNGADDALTMHVAARSRLEDFHAALAERVGTHDRILGGGTIELGAGNKVVVGRASSDYGGLLPELIAKFEAPLRESLEERIGKIGCMEISPYRTLGRNQRKYI